MPTRLSTIVVAATCALACGCGESEEPFVRAPVQGSVIAGSDALESGTIRFVPIEGTKGPIASAAVKDGHYEFTAENGPPVGKHRVEVVPGNFLGFDPGDQQAAERALRSAERPKNPVPRGYGARTPLRAVVEPEGSDHLDFMLTAKR